MRYLIPLLFLFACTPETPPIDLSGIAWDAPQAGTLISPKHIAMAAHFPRSVGSVVKFGEVSRTIVRLDRIPDTDVLIGTLDAEVPGVPVYAIGEAESGDDCFAVNQFKKIQPCEIDQVRNEITAKGVRLIDHDSGKPNFIMRDGVPMLVSLHSTAYQSEFSGPNYWMFREQIKQITGEL
jgi:hypothetical protein